MERDKSPEKTDTTGESQQPRVVGLSIEQVFYDLQDIEPTDEDLLDEEPSCVDFLINGTCPKSRYLSGDCPLNIIKDGYKNCVVKKEK